MVRLVRIERADAARFLIAPESYRYFEPFLAQENTVAGVARWLNVDASSVLYRVRQMLKLGLILTTREEKRNGRAIKHYRSSADAFFVPFSLTDAESIASLSAQFTTAFQRIFDEAIGRVFHRAGVDHDLGVRMSRTGENRWSRDLMPERVLQHPESFPSWLLDPEVPAVWNQYAILRLRPEHAKALQADLAALWEKYLVLESDDHDLHALRLGIVPLEK